VAGKEKGGKGKRRKKGGGKEKRTRGNPPVLEGVLRNMAKFNDPQ